MSILDDDTLYFSANDGSSGHELWAHDTSNHSTWQIADINSGSGSSVSIFMAILVGDTLTSVRAMEAVDTNFGRMDIMEDRQQLQDKLLVKLELTNRLRVKTNVLMLLLDIILLELRTLQQQVTTTLHHKYLVKQERTALKIQLLIAAYRSKCMYASTIRLLFPRYNWRNECW